MFLTERFAQFISHISFDELPDDVVTLAKERILDSIGAILAGAKYWDYRDPFLKACSGMGAGEMAAFTTGEMRFPACRAAMINAAFGHAVELDDGHAYAGAHAGTVVVPVALALAMERQADGRRVIEAVVAGYDVVYRIAAAMAPGQIERGFHPTSNDSTIGAAAAAGKIIGLDEKSLADALGMAGLYASGLMEATVTGQLSKCIMVGNAAYSGMSAAYYAANGIGGTISVFEGETGFFQAKSRDVNPEKVYETLGREFLIKDTYSKLYPTCRHVQPPMEGALKLLEAYRFHPEDVDKVWVGTHEVAYRLAGIIKEPKHSGEAKFSIAYGIAAALWDHGFGVGNLRMESITNPRILALAERVVTEIDPQVQAQYPTRRGAKIRIHLKDGRVLSEEVYDLKGSPGNPIAFSDIREKFITNGKEILPEADRNAVIDFVTHLEEMEDLRPLMELLTKER